MKKLLNNKAIGVCATYAYYEFDYGIGPSPSLAVSEEQKKYINTEKKRYKLYLSTIKGAPKKKNFKDSDFK